MLIFSSKRYGLGEVNGSICSDVVSVGGLVVKNQVFASVTQESADFFNDPAAGLLGLAFQSIANVSFFLLGFACRTG